MQNDHFGSKTKIAKDISKCILQIISSCSVKKIFQKRRIIPKNKIILKIVDYGKAIAHAKSSF